MLPSEIPKLPTDPPVRGFPGVWKLLFFYDSLLRTDLHPLCSDQPVGTVTHVNKVVPSRGRRLECPAGPLPSAGVMSGPDVVWA